jgi:hypothetical protein
MVDGKTSTAISEAKMVGKTLPISSVDEGPSIRNTFVMTIKITTEGYASAEWSKALSGEYLCNTFNIKK